MIDFKNAINKEKNIFFIFILILLFSAFLISISGCVTVIPHCCINTCDPDSCYEPTRLEVLRVCQNNLYGYYLNKGPCLDAEKCMVALNYDYSNISFEDENVNIHLKNLYNDYIMSLNNLYKLDKLLSYYATLCERIFWNLVNNDNKYIFAREYDSLNYYRRDFEENYLKFRGALIPVISELKKQIATEKLEKLDDEDLIKSIKRFNDYYNDYYSVYVAKDNTVKQLVAKQEVGFVKRYLNNPPDGLFATCLTTGQYVNVDYRYSNYSIRKAFEESNEYTEEKSFIDRLYDWFKNLFKSEYEDPSVEEYYRKVLKSNKSSIIYGATDGANFVDYYKNKPPEEIYDQLVEGTRLSSWEGHMYGHVFYRTWNSIYGYNSRIWNMMKDIAKLIDDYKRVIVQVYYNYYFTQLNATNFKNDYVIPYQNIAKSYYYIYYVMKGDVLENMSDNFSNDYTDLEGAANAVVGDKYTTINTFKTKLQSYKEFFKPDELYNEMQNFCDDFVAKARENLNAARYIDENTAYLLRVVKEYEDTKDLAACDLLVKEYNPNLDFGCWSDYIDFMTNINKPVDLNAKNHCEQTIHEEIDKFKHSKEYQQLSSTIDLFDNEMKLISELGTCYKGPFPKDVLVAMNSFNRYTEDPVIKLLFKLKLDYLIASNNSWVIQINDAFPKALGCYFAKHYSVDDKYIKFYHNFKLPTYPIRYKIYLPGNWDNLKSVEIDLGNCLEDYRKHPNSLELDMCCITAPERMKYKIEFDDKMQIKYGRFDENSGFIAIGVCIYNPKPEITLPLYTDYDKVANIKVKDRLGMYYPNDYDKQNIYIHVGFTTQNPLCLDILILLYLDNNNDPIIPPGINPGTPPEEIIPPPGYKPRLPPKKKPIDENNANEGIDKNTGFTVDDLVIGYDEKRNPIFVFDDFYKKPIIVLDKEYKFEKKYLEMLDKVKKYYLSGDKATAMMYYSSFLSQNNVYKALMELYDEWSLKISDLMEYLKENNKYSNDVELQFNKLLNSIYNFLKMGNYYQLDNLFRKLVNMYNLHSKKIKKIVANSKDNKEGIKKLTFEFKNIDLDKYKKLYNVLYKNKKLEELYKVGFSFENDIYYRRYQNIKKRYLKLKELYDKNGFDNSYYVDLSQVVNLYKNTIEKMQVIYDKLKLKANASLDSYKKVYGEDLKFYEASQAYKDEEYVKVIALTKAKDGKKQNKNVLLFIIVFLLVAYFMFKSLTSDIEKKKKKIKRFD